MKFKFIAEFADQLSEKFHGAPGRAWIVVNNNHIEGGLGLLAGIRGFDFKRWILIHGGHYALAAAP